MLQSKIIQVIENFAPLETQFSYDKCGYKTSDVDKEITAVLVCLDLNEQVISEAEKLHCNLIIEHHPSIWEPLTEINTAYPKVRALLAAVQKGITVYSAHTNIDVAENGLNDYFANQIGLTNIKKYSEGRIGQLKEPLNLLTYADLIKKTLSEPVVKIIGNKNKLIKNVACINGAGGGDEEVLLDFAQKTDVFVTAEVKYNVARLSKDIDYAIIEVSHFGSERGFMPLIKNLLAEKAPDVPVYISETLSDPYM